METTLAIDELMIKKLWYTHTHTHTHTQCNIFRKKKKESDTYDNMDRLQGHCAK